MGISSNIPLHMAIFLVDAGYGKVMEKNKLRKKQILNEILAKKLSSIALILFHTQMNMNLVSEIASMVKRPNHIKKLFSR